MSQIDSSMIRNIAVAGHGDSGKTSFVSSLLFTSGTTNRHLKVDDGNTLTDFDEDEIKRKISISTSICSLNWKKHKINLLDTPGYTDFICDTFPALISSDIAALVTGGGCNSEFNLERIWDSKDSLPPARVFLVNKLDRENTTFEKSVTYLQTLDSNAIPIALPIGKEAAFSGLVDLLENRAILFDSATGKFKPTDIPADMADEIEEARMALIEAVAEVNDQLLEKYLEGEEITTDEMKAALKAGLIEGIVFPIIPISAEKNVGAAFFLDFALSYLPGPQEVPAKKVDDAEIICDSNGKLIAQVFKTIVDPYTGKISLFRVYSGSFKGDQTVKNINQDETEKITTVFFQQGKNQNSTEVVVAGDIGAIAKSKTAKTGDTLCSQDNKITIQPLIYPTPLISWLMFLTV